MLKEAGLHIDWGEAVWCSTAQDSVAANITVGNHDHSENSRGRFKPLGVWITFDGHFTKELAEREVSAWRRFHALRHLLCDNRVALKYRLRLLTLCVVSSMYWCARSWILTHKHTMYTFARCRIACGQDCSATVGQSISSCMVTKRILPAISRGAVILHRSQQGIQRGKQAVFT